MSVTLHTNFGNIKIEVFCDQVPTASEVIVKKCAFVVMVVLTYQLTSILLETIYNSNSYS